MHTEEISPRGTFRFRRTKSSAIPRARRHNAPRPATLAPRHILSLSPRARDVSRQSRAGTRAPRSSPVVVSRFRDHARDRFSERPLDPRERESRRRPRDIRRRRAQKVEPHPRIPRVEEEASPARLRARRPPRGAPALRSEPRLTLGSRRYPPRDTSLTAPAPPSNPPVAGNVRRRAEAPSARRRASRADRVEDAQVASTRRRPQHRVRFPSPFPFHFPLPTPTPRDASIRAFDSSAEMPPRAVQHDA